MNHDQARRALERSGADAPLDGSAVRTLIAALGSTVRAAMRMEDEQVTPEMMRACLAARVSIMAVLAGHAQSVFDPGEEDEMKLLALTLNTLCVEGVPTVEEAAKEMVDMMVATERDRERAGESEEGAHDEMHADIEAWGAVLRDPDGGERD